MSRLLKGHTRQLLCISVTASQSMWTGTGCLSISYSILLLVKEIHNPFYPIIISCK